MNLISKFALACGLAVGAGSVAATAADQILAFPGAEGFGRYTIGGRYGANGNGTAEIYHVTNLNDSGTGSFRDAVSGSGRIIIFDVSGTIYLKSALVVKGHNTILGQTAPGEGVQVYGDRISFSGADQLIVRYMRFRMGKNGTSGKDACGVANGTDMIFDHLSVLWGLDENFSFSWDNKGKEPGNITLQNSIIGQGLQPHSCGGLHQTNGGLTIYRNLYIENKTRNPKVKGIHQFVNNVLYNWGNGAAYNMGGESAGTSWAEITDNYFVKGPWKSSTRPFVGGNETFHFYGDGNYYDSNKDGKLDGVVITDQEYTDWGGDRLSDMSVLNTGMAGQTSSTDRTFPEIAGRQTAPEALEWVLKNVGASLPVHDEVDQYLLDELASFGTIGTDNGISSETILPHKGVGTLYGGIKPKDTDNDGIPDEWEIENGLNPNDASDAVKINADGYTNLESYVFTITKAYPYLKNPTDLKASEIKKNAISITWTDNSDNETGFEVEISKDGTTFTKIGDVAPNVTAYTAADLDENTVYYFRVKVNGDDIPSVYSPVLKSRTIDEPFAPNASILTSPANGGNMKLLNNDLTWTNSTEDYFGQTKYTLYMGTSPDDLKEVTSGITDTTFPAYDIEVGNTYYWRVDATNDIGTTPSAVSSFTVTDGGTLFYTDFKNQPAAFAESEIGQYAQNGEENDFINGQTIEYNFGRMTLGSQGGRLRINGKCGNNAVSSEDEGATKSALWVISKNGNVNKNYIKITDIDGPWKITVYTYNVDGAAYSYNINLASDTDDDGVDDTEETVASISVSTTTKAVTKRTYTYKNESDAKTLIIRPSSSAGMEFNDILIERYVPGEVETLELKSGKLVNNIDYTDGSVSLTFSKSINFDDSDVTIDGKHQFEDITLKASGSTLTVNYSALDINSTYTITIPEGAITDDDDQIWEGGDIVLNTCDFPAAKKSGETHWGKAVANLPYDLVPFNSYTGITTVGNHVQAKKDDYPHWVSTSGSIAANSVSFKRVSSSDKVMAYFNDEPKKVEIKLECTSGSKGSIMVQETRNADAAPFYRTIRVFTEADLPFSGELPLNPETRFVKVLQKSYTSGEFKLTALKISDSDLSGLDVITVDEDAPVEYYNLQGIRVENPAAGLYIKRQGNTTTKVLIK